MNYGFTYRKISAWNSLYKLFSSTLIKHLHKKIQIKHHQIYVFFFPKPILYKANITTFFSLSTSHLPLSCHLKNYYCYPPLSVWREKEAVWRGALRARSASLETVPRTINYGPSLWGRMIEITDTKIGTYSKFEIWFWKYSCGIIISLGSHIDTSEVFWYIFICILSVAYCLSDAIEWLALYISCYSSCQSVPIQTDSFLTQ